MLRTSSVLTIALSLAAISSATVPATANPLTVFGGGSHLAQLPSAGPVLTRPQASQEASHVLNQKPVDLPPKIVTTVPTTSYGGSPMQIPKNHVIDQVQNAQIPRKDLPPEDICATHPYLQICRKDPPTPPTPVDCKTHPLAPGCFEHPPEPPPPPNCINTPTLPGCQKTPHPPGPGPVVIFVPQAPVQVPVAVPVAVPSGMPARVATGSNSSAAVTAPAQPVVTPACVTAADIPALGAAIDQLLPTAQLSEADMSKITELRQLIQVLATDGKVAAARDVEEDAMNRLGYQKIWLRCGLGTFEWQKQAVTQAVQAK